MNEASWFLEWIEQLAGSPLQQAMLAALSTLILEDPTTLGCGFLVADGKMSFLTAFLGLSIGISLGDLGLYFLGSFFGTRVADWGLVSEERLKRAEQWFRQNLVSAVVFSRFIPGMRLPTYVGAGILRAPLGKFLGVAVVASVVWTLLLLTLTVQLGVAFLPLLGRWKWPLAISLLVLVVGLQWLLARRSKPAQASAKTTSWFEFWPPYLFYIPVGLYYLGLALRYRSLTLPTAANPSVFAGGFIGESKSQILDLIPEQHQKWLAPYLLSPGLDRQTSVERLQRIEVAMTESGLDFPVVAKPDQGQRGAGVRPIRSRQDLESYLGQFPESADLVIQQLVEYEREAGILFYQHPGEPRGTISSITLKSFPRVIGDGHSSLEKLIRTDPRASQISEVYLKRHRGRLDWVPEIDQAVPLVFAGNHCQGAIFQDGTHLVTAKMVERFQEIVSALPEFYFGRFDVRFESLSGLTRGEGFRIIELNGAGAEATHIWDAGFLLKDAYRVLFHQFRVLFEIGEQNRRRGHRPLGIVKLIASLVRYWKVSRDYPETY